MAKRKARTGPRASIGLGLIDGDVFLQQLDKLVLQVQNQVIEESIQAGMQPILTAMIPNTPKSSGSREKQSKTAKQRWSGSKKLKDTIRAVVRKRTKYGMTSGATGLVGPSYTDGGGHGNLFSKDHSRRVLWGRDTGGVRAVNQFVKRTADQSRAAAQSALKAALAAGIDRAARATTK